MKNIITTLIIGLLITTTSASFAQRGEYRSNVHFGNNRPGPSAYENNYNLDRTLTRQLRQGVISKPQYRALKRELEYIDLLEQMAQIDGRVSRRERRLIKQTKYQFHKRLTKSGGRGGPDGHHGQGRKGHRN
jgi:hypothetical protein